MSVLTALYLALIVSGSVAAEEKLSDQTYPGHSRLMYYPDSGRRESPVKTKADWAHRRRDILAGMQRAMGELPKRTGLPPLDVRISECLDRKDYTRLTISFVAEKNDRAPQDKIRDRSAYEFLKDLDANGKPIWTSDVKEIQPVLALEDNRVVLRYQQAQVDKMLSISLQYGNVLYCMDNETNESSEWGAYWSNYIKEKAVEAGVVMHTTEMWDAYDLMHDHHKRTYDHPEIYSFCDISQNNHNRGQKHWDNIEKVRAYLTPIRPINSVKIYGSDEPYHIAPPGMRDGVGGRYGWDRDGLERFWRQIFGGMASSGFHRPPSGLGLTEKARAHIKSMRMLTGKMDSFTCEPHNDLLSNRKENGAYVIANRGKEYAVYFTNGDPVALDLSAVQGNMKAGWLDIAQSEWAKEGTLKGGGTVTLLPPGTGHWAVWIGRFPHHKR